MQSYVSVLALFAHAPLQVIWNISVCCVAPTQVWDLNKEAQPEVGRDYHLLLASNVLHTAADMSGEQLVACSHQPTSLLAWCAVVPT